MHKNSGRGKRRRRRPSHYRLPIRLVLPPVVDARDNPRHPDCEAHHGRDLRLVLLQQDSPAVDAGGRDNVLPGGRPAAIVPEKTVPFAEARGLLIQASGLFLQRLGHLPVLLGAFLIALRFVRFCAVLVIQRFLRI